MAYVFAWIALLRTGEHYNARHAAVQSIAVFGAARRLAATTAEVKPKGGLPSAGAKERSSKFVALVASNPIIPALQINSLGWGAEKTGTGCVPKIVDAPQKKEKEAVRTFKHVLAVVAVLAVAASVTYAASKDSGSNGGGSKKGKGWTASWDYTVGNAGINLPDITTTNGTPATFVTEFRYIDQVEVDGKGGAALLVIHQVQNWTNVNQGCSTCWTWQKVPDSWNNESYSYTTTIVWLDSKGKLISSNLVASSTIVASTNDPYYVESTPTELQLVGVTSKSLIYGVASNNPPQTLLGHWSDDAHTNYISHVDVGDLNQLNLNPWTVNAIDSKGTQTTLDRTVNLFPTSPSNADPNGFFVSRIDSNNNLVISRIPVK